MTVYNILDMVAELWGNRLSKEVGGRCETPQSLDAGAGSEKVGARVFQSK